MSKLGVGRQNAENRVKADTVPHPKVGEQGGRMYEIDAPLERLMHTIGAGFFNEPTYYQSGSENADGAGESAQSLMKTMREGRRARPGGLPLHLVLGTRRSSPSVDPRSRVGYRRR